MEDHIQKYPRTPHIRGSRLQEGDEDLEAVPFETLEGQYIIIEEKIDCANSGISFSDACNLLLQSRGHYLTGSPREKHFNLLATWANYHIDALFEILENKYIMYGEFCSTKHTEFYDLLPHYFLEFDIMEKSTGKFLSTKKRRELIGKAPITSVPVLWEGPAKNLDHLLSFIRPSLYKSANWKMTLKKLCEERGVDFEEAMQGTDDSDFSEGIYIKVETEEETIGRYKYVRASFLQSISQSQTHWLDRIPIPNQLAPDADIYRK